MASKGQASTSNQQTISSFFAKKRRSSTIDLTKNNSDEPPTKKSKAARVTSAFFEDSSGTPGVLSEVPAFEDVDKQRESSASMWRFSHLSQGEVGSGSGTSGSQRDDQRACHSRQKVTAISFREKLRRRDAAATAAISPEGFSDEVSPVPKSSNRKLQKFAAEDSIARIKATSRRKAHQAGPPLGPEGIPCTPLEEAVSHSVLLGLYSIYPYFLYPIIR
jgi:hypothetical protein